MSKTIDQVMAEMPSSWRYSWCSNGDCDCLGAVNCAGGLVAAGFNRQQWEAWVRDNPEAENRTPARTLSFNPPTPRQGSVRVNFQSADEFFAWQDSLTQDELEAYEEGRLATGERFETKKS